MVCAETAKALAEAMRWCMDHREALVGMGDSARALIDEWTARAIGG